MTPLPRIMVAPNGARRTKADHPELPISVAEIVKTAQACWAAGAAGLHAHIRDANGAHVLDAGLYRELLAEMTAVLPEMFVQITTEAVGKYTPAEQRKLVQDVSPCAVSISLREMLAEGPTMDFYHWACDANISVQHILYDMNDIALLEQEIAAGRVPQNGLQVLLVLGRYAVDQKSDPADLAPMVRELARFASHADWAACAFGQTETMCLKHAIELGGKVRVGFENNLYDAFGNLAANNAARVSEISGP